MSRCNPLALAAVLLCMVVLSSAHAGINEWTTKGPPGGYYHGFEPSSTDPDVFYAAYAHSFFRSGDAGNTWQSRSFAGQVQHIAVDPANGDRIFVSVVGEGLFRSIDGGRAFTQIAPATPTIWASAVGPNNAVYYASDLTFRRSNDGGDTFPQTTSVFQGIAGILVDPTNADRVYALHGSGLMRSTNGGVTWTEQYLPGGGHLYSIIRLASGGLVLAAGDGIYVSSDDGVTWTQQFVGSYSSLAVDPDAPETVIASGFASYSLLRSVDGGLSWSQLGAGFPRSARRALISRSGSASRLLTANFQGVQLSDDGGMTWRYAAQGPVAGGAQLATTVAASSKVYALSDWETSLHVSQNDSAWVRVAEGLTSSIGQTAMAVKPGDPNTIVLGAANRGVFRSTNGGVSWMTTVGQLADLIIESLAFDPQNPAILYASVSTFPDTSVASVYRSTDEGATWAPHSTNLQGIHAYHLRIDPADRARMFLAGLQASFSGDVGGLYFSGDTGVNWNRVAFDGQNVWDVAIDPADSDRIYAATQTGLQVSTNGGTSFAVSDSFAIATDNMEAGAIAIDPVIPTTVYITAIDAGYGCCAPQRPSGVLRSVDQGASWETLRASSEAEQWFSGSLVLDPNTPSRLYVSTGLHGVATFEVANDLSVTLSNHSGTRPLGLPSTFDMRVAHAGALAATGVRLVTTLPAALANVSATTDRGSCAVSAATLTCTIAVLRPAQVVNVHVTYTPPAATLLSVSTTLSAHENDIAPHNNTATASAIAGEVVDLAVTAVASTPMLDHGDNATLVVTVSNAGPSTASAATLTVTAPDGLSVGALPAGCVANGSAITCALTALTVGGTSSIEFPVTAHVAGTLITAVSVVAAPAAADVNDQDNVAQATIISLPVTDVSVAIADSADPVSTNTAFNYSVTLRNDGPDPAMGVVASVTVPGTVSSTIPTQGSCTNSAGTLQCQMGDLASGATATVTITTASSTAASLTAIATVTSTTTDRVTGNNSAQHTTTVNAPASGGGGTGGGGGASGGGGGTSGGGGGGGGAADPLLLLIGLALSLGAARRRAARARAWKLRD